MLDTPVELVNLVAAGSQPVLAPSHRRVPIPSLFIPSEDIIAVHFPIHLAIK